VEKKKVDKKEITVLKKLLKEKEKEIQMFKDISTNVYSSDIAVALQQIADKISTITGCDDCLVYLHDLKNSEFVLKASKSDLTLKTIRSKLPKEIGEKAAAEKVPFEPPMSKFTEASLESAYRSVLCMPFTAGDHVLAVANILSWKKHSYNKSILSILTGVTNQMSIAINNALLFEDLKSKNKELETLSQISKTIVSGKYLEEILNLIVTLTADMMGSKICSVMLLDKNEQELKIIATQSLSEDYKSKPNIKVGQSVSGKAVLEKRPIAVADVTKEAGYTYKDIAKSEGLCSMLAVPMTFRSKAIGCINIYTTEEHKFTSENIRVLQSVANQAAIVIENMSLIKEAIAAKEALETRKTIERAKGLLMKKFNIAEDEAYKTIHKKSMDSRKSMKEVAEAILLTLEQEK